MHLSKSLLLSLLSFLGIFYSWAQDEVEPSLPSPELENGLQLEPLTLPERNAEDWEAMKNGSLIPGSSLMGRLALEQLFSTKDERIIFETAKLEIIQQSDEDESWPVAIDDEFTGVYFEEPADSFVIDPQGLLTERDLLSQNGFLEQHANDSVIDLYVYLFEGKQDIPSKESPYSVLRNFFRERGDVAIVFYHLGRPDRTQLAYSARIHRGVSTEDRQQALKLSKEAAGEKSEGASQLESFVIEMSRRLYVMEKDLPPVGMSDEYLQQLATAQSEPEPTLWERIPEGVKTLFATLGLTSLLIAVGILCHRAMEKRRVYLFPDAEGPSILDAPHAAGVGGVLSYASALNPPSEQKEKSGDFLQEL